MNQEIRHFANCMCESTTIVPPLLFHANDASGCQSTNAKGNGMNGDGSLTQHAQPRDTQNEEPLTIFVALKSITASSLLIDATCNACA
jgi:hypothetical protein